MPDTELIGPVADATSADASRTPDRTWQVPYDLLKEASKRLEIMSLLAAVLWILATTADKIALFVMSHGERMWRPEPMTDVIAAVSIAASLGLFFYIRKGDRHPQFVLDLGLVYMVFTAAALGLVMHWSRVPHDWPATPMI